MTSCVTEILSDGGSCEWSIVAKSSRICSSRSDYYGIVHRPFLLERLHKAGNSRSLLTDSHIYTIYRLPCLICCTLIQDRINSDCCLTCLTVADDELTLTTTDWNHRVDGLETSLKRLCNRLTEDHARSLALKRHLAQIALDLALTVKRLTKRVHDASHHTLADIQRCDSAGTLDGHSLLDLICRAKKHGSDIVLLEVHHDSLDAVLELEKLACLRLQ